jgi:hypothetical protein
VSEFGQHIVGISSLIAASVVFVSALRSRNLFALTMRFAAGSALTAAGFAALGGGAVAFAVALGYAAVCPVVLLVVTASSARAVKTQADKFAWPSATIAACALGGAICFALPELRVFGGDQGKLADVSWIAGLFFVVAAGCNALLGYGERGAFASLRRGSEHAR